MMGGMVLQGPDLSALTVHCSISTNLFANSGIRYLFSSSKVLKHFMINSIFKGGL